MKKVSTTSLDRRTFIKAMLRWLMAGGFLVSGAILAGRKEQKTASQENCDFVTPCQNCLKFSGCSQPKARQIKSAAEKKEGKYAGS